jgi:sugar lactone lactonase YvrE
MQAKTERDDCNHLTDSHSRMGVTAQVSRAAIAACMATMLILLCIIAGTAFADDGELPNGPYLASEAEEVADAGSLVNSGAADEMPHSNLDREGASELVEGVFGPVLESVSGPFDDLQVDHFLADNVAVVTPTQPEEGESDSAGPLLVDSMLPLRTENDQGQVRQVDLGLEHDDGELQPVNPLVDVGIPNELGDGIKLPEMGITIGVGGAPEQVSPSIVGESVALYPNISEDTDFAVAPTPTGVETLTTIRSPQSPTAQTYTFTLPEGAELRLLKDDGGAEIAQGDESLVQIPPPSALDATGAPVETTLGVSSGALTVSVEPAEDAAYPILVDPLFQTYEWKVKNSTTGINFNSEDEEWRQDERNKMPGNSPGYTEWYLHKQVPTANYPIQSDWRGLYVHGHGELRAGDHFGYMYSVPRYYSDQKTYGTKPESYISRMTLSNVVWVANSPSLSPYMLMGLYDPTSGYVSFYKHEGLTNHGLSDMAFSYPFENKVNTSVKTAFVGFESYENVKAINALYVGSAVMEMAEPAGNVPGLTAKGAAPWVSGKTPAPVEFTASDSGLGVYSVTATDEKNETHTWKATYGCTGVPGSACPRTWKSTDVGHPGPIYDPSVLPEGEAFLKVKAEDPLGNASETIYVLVKIDRTSPSLALTGTITEQAKLGKKWPSYALKVNASDGTEAAPQAGVVKTAIKVDGKVEDEKTPGCSTKNCSVQREWQLDASKYSPGPHVVEVLATDAVGLTTTKTVAIELNAASPPSVGLSGSMTEQATLGASRPRYKLAVNAKAEAGTEAWPSVPTYQSSFGSAGVGDAQFNLPADVAVDLQGSVWVVDKNNSRLEKFNGAGEYLGKFGAAGSGNGQLNQPSAVATDAGLGLWVIDTGNNRIEKFNANAEYQLKFGATGSGNGQFNKPQGIAIDAKGAIWVADTLNGRLQRFNAAGEFLKVIGSKGTGNGQFTEPASIDIGPGGHVWVADQASNRITELNEAGEFVRQFGTAGSGNGQFSHPNAIDVDSKGNVWVGDQNNNRIQQFNQVGEFVTKFGSAGSGAGQFSFGSPMGIATDNKGGLWIADANNNRVEKWAVPAYRFTYQSSFGSAGTGNGQLSAPADIALDSQGYLWVVDKWNGRIEKFNQAGEYLAQFGSKGTGDGQFNRPTSIAIDSAGNFWIADSSNNRIQKFNEKGEFLMKFGFYGTLDGQFNKPEGIATDSKGNVWVADTFNSRIQKFTSAGKFVSKFGSQGSGPGQLGEPTGIDIGPDQAIWVAEAANNRVSQFNEAGEFVQQFGIWGGWDGRLNHPDAIDVDNKGNVWVGDQNNSRIQQFNQAGEYITQFGSKGAGIGQFSISAAMGIATDNKNNLWITDVDNNRVQKWSQAAGRSEIAAEITVDGKRVDLTEAACAIETCAVGPGWTLESPAYSVGKHTVSVLATDGLGRATTKSLTIELQKDVTKPTLETTGGLATAPEGWVEQQTYNLNATATDAGYGLTSLIAKIDGKQVGSWANACVDGGCKATISKAIDMSAYSGGSHPAEVVATDGAGNVAKKTWTINVDPEGHISVEEAADTLEAVEETTDANPIGPPKKEDQYYGTAPGLGLAQTGDEIVATGSEVPTAIASDPSSGIELQILPDDSLAGPCETEYSSPEAEAAALGEDKPELETVKPVVTNCEEKDDGSGFKLESITVNPTATAPTATATEVIGSQAAVASNTGSNVDSIVRPLYEGVLTFQDIRDATASETFSWEVELTGGQQLKLLDSQHAAVYYAGGHPAFGIQAVAAHDAIGTAVPTKLEVSGNNLLTLRIEHHAGAFVYPVLSGVGWQGGFVSTAVQGPKDEQELKEERERIAREEREAREEEEAGEQSTAVVSESGVNLVVTVAAIGPPMASASSSEDPPPGGNGVYTFAHKYKFVECRYDILIEVPEPGPDIPQDRREATRKCEKEVEAGSHPKLIAAMAVHGWFHDNQVTNWVWIRKGNLHCDKWGSEQPAMVKCEKRPAGPSHTDIHLLGDYRFPGGEGNFYSTGSTSACDTIRGRLEVGPTYHQEESIVSPAMIAFGKQPQEPCNWP